MNAITEIDATSGIQFRAHPTQIDTWTVEVDGIEAGTIEGSGTKFTPRCGRPYQPRLFHECLSLIAEVARHRRAVEASTAGMSEKEARIARLEALRDTFEIGAASHVDVAARSAEIDRRIALVRGL